MHDNQVSLESMDTEVISNFPSLEWLSTNGFTTREQYLEKLRIVKRQILDSVSNGLLIEATPEEVCKPQNPHHYHTYKVPEEKFGHVKFSAIIKEPNNDTDKNINVESASLSKIEIGHPCAVLFVYNRFGLNEMPNLQIALPQVININILSNTINP